MPKKLQEPCLADPKLIRDLPRSGASSHRRLVKNLLPVEADLGRDHVVLRAFAIPRVLQSASYTILAKGKRKHSFNMANPKLRDPVGTSLALQDPNNTHAGNQSWTSQIFRLRPIRSTKKNVSKLLKAPCSWDRSPLNRRPPKPNTLVGTVGDG